MWSSFNIESSKITLLPVLSATNIWSSSLMVMCQLNSSQTLDSPTDILKLHRRTFRSYLAHDPAEDHGTSVLFRPVLGSKQHDESVLRRLNRLHGLLHIDRQLKTRHNLELGRVVQVHIPKLPFLVASFPGFLDQNKQFFFW